MLSANSWNVELVVRPHPGHAVTLGANVKRAMTEGLRDYLGPGRAVEKSAVGMGGDKCVPGGGANVVQRSNNDSHVRRSSSAQAAAGVACGVGFISGVPRDRSPPRNRSP